MRRDAIQDGGYSSTVYPISFVWLGGIYKSKKHLEHKVSSQGIPIHMGIFGFLFSLLDIFFIICIEQLAKYMFCYKARFNTSSFFILSYLHFGELCECGFYDRLLSLYQYIVFEGNRVLTLNLTLTESTSEMYSQK